MGVGQGLPHPHRAGRKARRAGHGAAGPSPRPAPVLAEALAAGDDLAGQGADHRRRREKLPGDSSCARGGAAAARGGPAAVGRGPGAGRAPCAGGRRPRGSRCGAGTGSGRAERSAHLNRDLMMRFDRLGGEHGQFNGSAEDLLLLKTVLLSLAAPQPAEPGACGGDGLHRPGLQAGGPLRAGPARPRCPDVRRVDPARAPRAGDRCAPGLSRRGPQVAVTMDHDDAQGQPGGRPPPSERRSTPRPCGGGPATPTSSPASSAPTGRPRRRPDPTAGHRRDLGRRWSSGTRTARSRLPRPPVMCHAHHIRHWVGRAARPPWTTSSSSAGPTTGSSTTRRAVEDAVVRAADEDEVVQRRIAAVDPVPDVVRVAHHRRSPAAGEGAVAVPDDQRRPDRGGDQPLRPSDVEDRAVRIQHPGDDVGVTGQPPHRGRVEVLSEGGRRLARGP